VGIYSGEAMSYAFGGPRLHPLLDGTDVVSSYAAILILGVIAALYPAYLASKMEPVEALRYV
jgi:ABC-type antimicrobial peptide transport system permease subunit